MNEQPLDLKRLVAARVAAELTQVQLGEKLSLSRKSISAKETGARPISTSELSQWAKVLDKPPGYFFAEVSP